MAGNSAEANGGDADIYNFSGTYHNNGGNFASTNASSTSTINPNLTALGNYGGPTQTMIPQPGSAAICAGLGNSSAADADQRG